MPAVVFRARTRFMARRPFGGDGPASVGGRHAAALAVVICLAAGLLAGCDANMVPDGANVVDQTSLDPTTTGEPAEPDGDDDVVSEEIVDPAEVENGSPVAKVHDDISAEPGDIVTLDGSASFDPDGDVLSYSWRQVAGQPSVTINDSAAAVASFEVPGTESAARLTFELTVDDGLAQDSATLNVQVAAPPRPATVLPAVTIESTTTNGEAPVTIAFVALTDAVPPATAVFSWDFGDGEQANGSEVEHEFTEAGAYTVSVCLSLADDEAVPPSCGAAGVVVTAPPPPVGGGGGTPPPPADLCDADADGDGVFDCDDLCPDDSAKSEPGVCGCGVSDADSDSDGVADCLDECPGAPDVDSDGDGTLDCDDLCPNDGNKTAPGTCGCGASDADSDGDGVADCLDECPGAPDVDSDDDGVLDCDDLCPSDSGKTAPGTCGCGVSDADTDGDGVADCFDECPGTPDVDSDGDGTLDCDDLCPADGGKTEPGACGCGVADVDTNGDGITDCLEVQPDERTAEMPDSWLVLYNINSADSVTWASWYLDQWGIPAENALGLDVDPAAERIHRDACVNDIYLAVHDYLDTHPQVEARIMGILVGYRVPGNYYLDADTPEMNGGGGWSVAAKLQHIEPFAVDYIKWPRNVHRFVPGSTGDSTRLTKAALTPHHYLSARIDGPTLADAMALTTRARAITTGQVTLPETDWLYYDYDDPDFGGSGARWEVLRATVESLVTSGPPERYPWRAFESEGVDEEATPDCAMRFSFYRLTGWQNAAWGGEPAGTRILGYALNSFGATTVRSTTAQGGRYVPNALVNGGFAAAVGATAEPYMSTAPVPATMVWCLADGRTVAEAFYHSNEFVAWMWELDGDPLMRVPDWFGP